MSNPKQMENPKIVPKSKSIVKTYADLYLYNIANSQYDKRMFEFIMTSEVVDPLSDAFSDIMYDVKKRQTTSVLFKVLQSKNVMLMYNTNALPKALSVFVAQDVKRDNKLKVFIDISNICRLIEGKWICHNTDILVAYLINAMNSLIYYVNPKRLIMKSDIINEGTKAFAYLFTHIIDYLFKITSVSSMRDKCLYLASLYYNANILNKDITDNVSGIAEKISGLSQREQDIIKMQLNPEVDFINIKYFLEAVSRILRLSKLTVDVFLEKFVYIYGTGTQFALEYYPAFAAMLTNAYTGCYINNQKTIEKIVGQSMIKVSQAIFAVGSESI